MNKNFNNVVWADSGKSVSITGGELFGLIQSRDVKVQSYIDGLDSLAKSLMSQVNAVHQAGFGLKGETGLNFFVGTNASDMTVNAELVYDPSKIAASGQNVNMSGNGDTAAAIANIRTKASLNSGSTSINDFYQNLISKMGTATSEAKTKVDMNTAMMTQVDTQIASVSGVSIDEEMSNMIKFEHAYGAAAKYIATVQRTLDDLMAVLK